MKSLLVAVIFLLALTLIPLGTTSAGQQPNEDNIRITAEALLAKLNKGEPVMILDVRTEGQYKSSGKHIKGDMRLEEAEIDTQLKDVPKDKLLVTYCTCPDEATSGAIADILREKGFKNVRALKGGYYAWLRVDGPLEVR